MANARAQLTLATGEFDRAKMLFDKQLLSKSDFDQKSAQAEVARRQFEIARNGAMQQYQGLLAARARVMLAKKALADTIVRAPFAGVVGQRLVSVGDYVQRGTKVASVLRTNPLRVQLTVPEQFSAGVAVGRSVSFEVDASPGQKFTGQVRYVSPALEADSRTLVVEAVVPNDSGALKPGAFATALIEQANRSPGVLTPAAAVRTVSGTSRVFVVAGDTAEERIVTIGQPLGDLVEITNGLKAGEKVATSNVDAVGRRRPGRRRSRCVMQWLAELCVRRPVFASVLILSLVVVGAFAFGQLGIDRLPKVDFPTVTVTTRLPGAAPEQVESEVTDKVEEAVNTISGIDQLNSNSAEGISQVIVTFRLEKNADVAAQEVRDRVNRILPLLPRTIMQPTIEKQDPDAAPILTIAVTANKPIRDVTEYADKVLRRRLESADGVGQVLVLGGRKRQINVWVDADRLRAYNLTVNDVSRTLQSQNADIPGGRIDQGRSRSRMRTRGRVERARGVRRPGAAASRRPSGAGRRRRPRRRRRRRGDDARQHQRRSDRAAAGP